MDEYPDIGSSVPMPALGPDDLGLPPAPVAPVRPAMAAAPANDFKSRILKLIAVGVAGGLGPGAGTGILQGMNQASARKAQEQKATDQIARQTYQQDRTDYEQQQRIYETEAQKRQATMAQTLQSLRTVAPKVKSKEEYEQYVTAYANGLQSMGYRVNANLLRAAAPYVAPTAKDQAQKVFDAFLKNPANKAMLEQHPEQIEKTMILFDRDGDGEPEQVPLKDVAAIAQMPFGTDTTGKVIVYPKGTAAETKANADGILQSLMEQAQGEGKQITPELKIKLQREAIKIAAEAKPDTTDPALAAIRTLQLQQMQNQPKNVLPPKIQQQVDSLSKGFDTQPAVKNTQVMSEAAGFVQNLDLNTKSAADDQALIYAFAKVMDPNSAVREGEYATIQRYAQSLASTYGFNAARVFGNTPFLNATARGNLKATILEKFKAGKAQYDVIRRSYIDRINKKTGRDDGDDYLTDYGGAFPADAPAPSAAASGQQKLAERP